MGNQLTRQTGFKTPVRSDIPTSVVCEIEAQNAESMSLAITQIIGAGASTQTFKIMRRISLDSLPIDFASAKTLTAGNSLTLSSSDLSGVWAVCVVTAATVVDASGAAVHVFWDMDVKQAS